MPGRKSAIGGKQKETSAKTPAKKRRCAAAEAATRKRDARIEVFVAEYLIDLNGRRAAIAAGYSPDAARSQASKLLALPHVQDRVEQAMRERAERTGITSDRVLERLWGIATADARELIELHRACCRYCWGEGNRYQRTPRELADAIREFEATPTEDRVGLQDPRMQGGTGYNPRRDPNPDCPECFGEGVERVVPRDTRDLSPVAKHLYAGVKQTRDGLQVLLHDQRAALVDVGKHLGMFRDRVEHSSDPENPMPAATFVIVPPKVPTRDDD